MHVDSANLEVTPVPHFLSCLRIFSWSSCLSRYGWELAFSFISVVLGAGFTERGVVAEPGCPDRTAHDLPFIHQTRLTEGKPHKHREKVWMGLGFIFVTLFLVLAL